MLRVALALLALAAPHHPAPSGPKLLDFRASNGGRPFAGDGPLLTTLTASHRTARIAFTLTKQARVVLRAEVTDRTRHAAELDASDGRVGYAPFVVRPAELGANSRIAVILPTSTGQAYNFYDADATAGATRGTQAGTTSA